MPQLQPFVLAPLFALSAYALHPTYQSITRSMTYEDSTKKLARYSDVADRHLWKTRKTLGAATVVILSSLGLSTYLATAVQSSTTTTTTNATILISSITAALGVTNIYVRDYWRGSAKIPAPGMGDYNDAISSTRTVSRCLSGLTLGWLLCLGVSLIE